MNRSGPQSTEVPSGLLVIDKLAGPTSHDVVAHIRRRLNTRSVGHAGTLDPMATGVLLVMVGEGTKLSRCLSLERKSYLATISFGVSTDTLDGEGLEVARGEVPMLLRDALRGFEPSHPTDLSWEPLAQALARERAREAQTPPVHSAIKRDGIRSYVRARRGESVTLPERPVRVFELAVRGGSAEAATLTVWLSVSKGYYVRAFARDLGEALGVPSHLSALRRTETGPFTLQQAIPSNADGATLRAGVMPLADVARCVMSCAVLNHKGVDRALQGKPLSDSDFEVVPGEGMEGWLSPNGMLVAIGDRSRGRPTVVRAFSKATRMC